MTTNTPTHPTLHTTQSNNTKAKKAPKLTEGNGGQSHQDRDEGTGQEPVERRVQTNHEVHDGGVQERVGHEERHLDEVLGQEVHVGPVHAVVVFS